MTSPRSSSPAPLIWINGFPGVGKLTIARELVKLMTSESDVTLIDNHQLIDPVAARFDRDHPEYEAAREAERSKAFTRWVTNVDEADRTIVFTDCQFQTERGKSRAATYKSAAAEANRLFIPICLICDKAENLNRAVSNDRVTSGTTKLVDVQLIREILDEDTILMLGIANELILDVSKTSPLEAAQRLVDHIKSVYI